MHVGYGNFGCRNEEKIIGCFECVVLKLRKLTCTCHRCSVNKERRKNFGISMFGVRIEIKVDNRSFKSCTETFVEMKACTGYLCSCFRIKNSEVCTDIPMSLIIKVKLSWLTPAANFNIFAVIFADRNALVRNIRKFIDKGFLLCVKLCNFSVVRFDF